MILRRPLGSTGTEIPEIGLGTWRYAGGTEPLRCGIEAGAFIDTAESYGTEPIVGEAIAGVRDRVFLATKVSQQHLRRTDVIRAADQSLARLRTDYIDLYQIHHPNDEVPMDETIGAMEELVDAGKIRFIGVSNFTVRHLKQAQQALRRHRIASNQVRYNLVDRTIETELLPYCATNQITVIAFSPFAREMQRLRDGDPDKILDRVAARTGRTAAQIALNWCLRPQSVVAIPKSDSASRVRENCGASGWKLDPEDFRLLDQGIRFRRRSRWESVLRHAIPQSVTPALHRLIRQFPAGLRRRLL